MTVGAPSMDLHTNRRRHRARYQDKQWVHLLLVVTDSRNLRHRQGQILADLR